MRVAVLGVDDRGDGFHDVQEQLLHVRHQAGAMERDAGLIADRRQQLELGLAELVRAVAVDVQHAENRFRRPHRRAHHRADALTDDALAGAVSRVGQRVVREGRDAVLEDVAHDGSRQHHVPAAAGPGRGCARRPR